MLPSLWYHDFKTRRIELGLKFRGGLRMPLSKFVLEDILSYFHHYSSILLSQQIVSQVLNAHSTLNTTLTN